MNRKTDTSKQAGADTFKAAFCRFYSCKPDNYEHACFVKNLFLHARFCYWLFYGNKETVFREDFDLLRELATVSCPDTFASEVNRFYGRNVREKSFVRRVLKIRLSGRKIRRMGGKLLKDNPSTLPLFQRQAEIQAGI